MTRLALAALVSLLGCSAPQRGRIHVTRSGPVSSTSGVIRFWSDVDNDSADAAIAAIDEANARGVPSITINFDSGGGSIRAGFRLAKTIENSRAPVTCVVDGTAASMAHYLLQSCHVRLMTSRSVLMLHDAALYGEFGGQAPAWQNIANRLRVLSEALSQHQCRRLSISFTECRARSAAPLEWWMGADEALAVGAIDGIVRLP